ncbi:MAG: vWA domain-containing protein [Spirillospora sp.]
MSARPDFAVRIYQNQYLPVDGTQVHAIVGVEARTGAPVRPAAEVVIVDTSASMAGARLVEAQRAAKAAVDALRPNVDFAVVSGARDAVMIYPDTVRLAPATDRDKTAAKKAISELSARGGTRIGRWLTLAGDLFDGSSHAVRHAVLLTDGQNEHEDRADLDAALTACAGRFVCDCRGVGADWNPAELREIAVRLLGHFKTVTDPRNLTADLTGMIGDAMGKAVSDVALRVWTPYGASVRFVKQVAPGLRDLTGRRIERESEVEGTATGDYATGIWGSEQRHYHLCVTVPPGRPRQSMHAAQVSMVLPGSGDPPDEEPLAEGMILVEWTDDAARPTGRHPSVEHYSRQAEVADSVGQGLAAYKKGDDATAAGKFRLAGALAARNGDAGTTQRLGRLVVPETGEIRPRADVDPADLLELDTESTESTQPPPEDED